MMLSRRIKSGFLTPVICFAALTASAQKYRAAVQKIDSPGFYKISLQPSFVAKSEPGLTDLRLMDASGREVPFVNAADVPVRREENFEVFPIVKTLKKDTVTSIVIENKTLQPIERLWLKVKNTQVTRTMDLMGSDDLEHWFAIEEGVPLDQPDLTTNGVYVSSITFPASNYHYLKILVNDKNKAPINFLEAGVYTISSLQRTVYQPILPVKITQRDSAKTSYVTILLDDKYLVNKILLNIGGPKYFKRLVSIYSASEKTPELVSESELNSNTSPELFLSAKTNKLILEINNADNLPLAVSGADVYQTDEFIVSYLDTGKYYLVTSEANATPPNYDLKFFTDSLRAKIPGIGHLTVTQNPAYHLPVVKAEAKLEYTIFIWIAIVIALLLLSLLTWKMIGEVGKKA